jgi:regulator of protease activity HflC (stomatin/prohibitin superfamily)
MYAASGIRALAWIVIAGLGVLIGFGLFGLKAPVGLGITVALFVLVASYVAAGLYIAREWERLTVLQLGKFVGMKGPGLVFIWPIWHSVAFTVDIRLVTYDVPKQKSLSTDNIPVTVDAIVYYRVADPKLATLHVENYHKATQLGAQSLLRDLIGKASLDELLSEREKLSQRLRVSLDELTDVWGIKVTDVEIKEVIISEALEDAIAREPAAEREKRARLKLAEAERLSASIIWEAAQTYERDPVALQLRSMNMLYEMCMEGRSTVIFVPTETRMGMPTPLGVYGLTEKIGTEAEAASTRSRSGPVGEVAEAAEEAMG